LIISPNARHGFVDHTLADHTSILKFIETVFSLPALASIDASASNLLEAFDFGKAPRHPVVLPGKFVPDHYPLVIAPQTTNTGEATGPASQRPGSLRALDPFASSILIGGVIGLLVLVAFQRHRRIVSREP
jgi:phospholipase C